MNMVVFDPVLGAYRTITVTVVTTDSSDSP